MEKDEIIQVLVNLKSGNFEEKSSNELMDSIGKSWGTHVTAEDFEKNDLANLLHSLGIQPWGSTTSRNGSRLTADWEVISYVKDFIKDKPADYRGKIVSEIFNYLTSNSPVRNIMDLFKYDNINENIEIVNEVKKYYGNDIKQRGALFSYIGSVKMWLALKMYGKTKM